jgi:hypothetical protein
MDQNSQNCDSESPKRTSRPISRFVYGGKDEGVRKRARQEEYDHDYCDLFQHHQEKKIKIGTSNPVAATEKAVMKTVISVSPANVANDIEVVLEPMDATDSPYISDERSKPECPAPSTLWAMFSRALREENTKHERFSAAKMSQLQLQKMDQRS